MFAIISVTITNKKHLKNVGPIRYCEPPLHCQLPGVASRTPAIAIAQAACDIHDINNNNNNDNAWQMGPLWPMEWAQLLIIVADYRRQTSSYLWFAWFSIVSRYNVVNVCKIDMLVNAKERALQTVSSQNRNTKRIITVNRSSISANADGPRDAA